MRHENSWRFMLLPIFLGLAGFAIFIQTVRFQIIPEADEVRRIGEESFEGAWVEVFPPRGLIYDREGHLLAGNAIVYEVGIELQFVENADTIARVLNAVLGIDYTEALGIANIPYSTEAVYAVVEQGISSEKAEILKAFINRWREDVKNGVDSEESLAGLVLFPYLHRTYPEMDVGSSVLGFVALDGLGYYGIEQNYNTMLSGIKRKLWVPNNPNFVTEQPEIPPGASLVLTMDRDIQVMVEQALDEAVEKYKAKSATAIIMNPETGEIYAMATTPRVNLNEYWTFRDIYPDTIPFNRAISQSFEPGSVFKIFTMAAAIDSETVKPETTFFDPGYYDIGGIRIRNWNADAWGEQTMIGCLQHSLNVCLAWVGEEMGADLFYTYMDAFGFGHFTGIDLAGEASGRLKEPGDGDWYPADLGTNTFGQGISVTPIQMMMAASALANEGKMVTPHVVGAIVDKNSQYKIHTQYAGQPITAESAEIITEMLAISLETESSLALVGGYRLAGKTGTAEIPAEGGYTREITNASFMGWGPVDDPKFMVYVWIEEPSPIWGSMTAAPTFSQIVRRLVVLLNIPPDSVRSALEAAPVDGGE